MIVYHGSFIEVKNPDILIGRTDIDFGQGFYVTKDKRMAEKWAAWKTISINNMYELNLNGLNVITLGLTRQWLDFIAYNRGYSDQSFDISDVDVIIGPTADDKMFNTISSYLEGDLSAEKAIKYLNIVGYSNQIALKTERAINNISFIKSMEIKGLQIMKDDYSDIRHALCASMGMMFERVVDQKDLIDFSLRFFKSDVYKRYPDDWTIFSQSPLYVLQLFKEELQEKTGKSYDTLIKQNDKYEKDVAYWFGFLITDWRVEHDFDPSSLTRDNLIWLYVNYDTLHTQSCKYVYEVFQEEKGQTFPDIQM